MLDIEDRFYTSTEVADILGVSLRSIYRYLEEGKIKAEVKTATGRHRFTKQNILDFLKPQADRVPEEKAAAVAETPAPSEEAAEPGASAPAEPVAAEEAAEGAPPAEAEESEEKKDSVDWLEKFKEAAAKHRAEQETSGEEEKAEAPEEEKEEAAEVESVSGLAAEAPAQEEEEEKEEETPYNYYKSAIGGLKDIAQNLDKSAKKASLEYAFTMNAGLSLHKPIKPFSLLHSYIRTQDKDFYEKVLKLTPSTKESAQLCLIVSDEAPVYESRKELHGLYVVSDVKLRADLMEIGEEELAKELE